MVDFLKESRKASVDKSFKELQEQRINQMKSLEKWDISNTLSDAVHEKIKSKKNNAKDNAKSAATDLSNEISMNLDKLHMYVKGKVTSGIKETYDKEDKKLKEL